MFNLGGRAIFLEIVINIHLRETMGIKIKSLFIIIIILRVLKFSYIQLVNLSNMLTSKQLAI